MIDIHTHILPGVDDGAKTLDEALTMARIGAADGITHIFATPHSRDCGPITRQEVAQRVVELQAAFDAHNIAIKLIPGHEVRLYDDMFNDWEQELAGPLGHSRYVLAEPLFQRYSKHTEAMIFELFDRGYIPVMAHPERIIPIQHKLSLIEPFLARGGLTQLTATTLTDKFSARAKETAKTMLTEGMAHIIASDAHHAHARTPSLTAARDIAAEIVGLERATMMVTSIPMAIVNNEPIADVLQMVQTLN